MINAPLLLSGSVSSQRGCDRETEGRQTEADEFYTFLKFPQGRRFPLQILGRKKRRDEKEMWRQQ